MPLKKETLIEGGQQNLGPAIFIGPVDHTDAISVDLSALSTDEVDEHGWLKAGVPLTEAGALVGLDETVYGVTIAPAKVASGNTGLSGSVDVAVATIGQLNRDAAEDELGRAYTADEVAGFAGSLIKLIQ